MSIYGVKNTDDANAKTTVWPYKHYCFDLLRDNYDNGVYVIHRPGGHVTDTWCDMTNGGWTVILRRMDGSEDFYRGWDDYVAGFGNRTGEYWLGLENIHQLTKNGSELVVYIEAFPGVKDRSMTTHYSRFKIGNNVSKYRLHINGNSGSCGDSLTPQNGSPFTTIDNDNDNSPANCAEKYDGAWWHNNCYDSSLNGRYFMDGDSSALKEGGKGIHWAGCWSYTISAKTAVMKVRRKP